MERSEAVRRSADAPEGLRAEKCSVRQALEIPPVFGRLGNAVHPASGAHDNTSRPHERCQSLHFQYGVEKVFEDFGERNHIKRICTKFTQSAESSHHLGHKFHLEKFRRDAFPNIREANIHISRKDIPAVLKQHIVTNPRPTAKNEQPGRWRKPVEFHDPVDHDEFTNTTVNCEIQPVTLTGIMDR